MAVISKSWWRQLSRRFKAGSHTWWASMERPIWVIIVFATVGIGVIQKLEGDGLHVANIFKYICYIIDGFGAGLIAASKLTVGNKEELDKIEKEC